MPNSRSLTQQLYRYGGVLFLLAWPLFGVALPVSIFAIAAGAILVYEGLEQGPVLRFFLLLVLVELIYGLDIGILSLAYLCTAATMVVISQWINISPLMRESGWSPAALIRSLVVGVLLAATMTAFSIIVGIVLYHYQSLHMRLAVALGHLGIWWMLVAGMAIAVLFLRRIDMPFRRRVVFGT